MISAAVVNVSSDTMAFGNTVIANAIFPQAPARALVATFEAIGLPYSEAVRRAERRRSEGSRLFL